MGTGLKLVGAVILVAGSAFLIWTLLLPQLAEQWITARLDAAGLPVASIEVERLGLSGARLRAIRIGDHGGPVIGHAEISYHPRGLIGGRADRLILRQAQVTLDVGQDGRLQVRGLALPGRGRGGSPALPQIPAERIEIADSELRIVTPYGAITGPVDLLVTTDQTGTLMLAGELRLAAGQGNIAVQLRGTVTKDGVEADLSFEDGTIALGPIRAAGVSGWGSLAAGRDAAHLAGGIDMATLQSGSMTLTDVALLVGGTDRPRWTTVRARLPAAQATLRLDGLLDAAGGFETEISLGTEALGQVLWLGQRTGPGDASVLVTLSGPVQPLLDTVRHGTPETGLAMQVDASLDVAGENAAGLVVDDGRLTLDGTLVIGRDHLRIEPAGCLAFDGALSALDGVFAVPDGIRLCAAGKPLLTATFEGGMLQDTEAAFDADALRLRLQTGPTNHLMLADVQLEGMTVATHRDGAGGAATVDASVDGGGLAIPDLQIALAGLAGTVQRGAQGDSWPSGTVSIGTVRSTADPPLFPPLSLSGSGRRLPERAIAFDLAAKGEAAAIELRGEGRHDFATGSGRIDLRLDPIRFTPDGLQPADLLPLPAAVPVEQTTGTLSAEAFYAWGRGSGSGARLQIEDFSFSLPYLTATGVSADLHADRLWPLRLPAGQQILVGTLDCGLVLENGTITLGPADAEGLEVAEIIFGLAGGTVGTGPFRVTPSAPPTTVTLWAENLDLAQLMSDVPVNGLTATGRLRGRVPLRLGNDTIFVEDGLLETTGPGVIRYAPATSPDLGEGGAGMDLVYAAMRNFRYRRIAAELDGRTGDEVTVALRIEGSNPDLYDGYPIAINVNLSGALDQILRQSLLAGRYAERAEEVYRMRVQGGVSEEPPRQDEPDR